MVARVTLAEIDVVRKSPRHAIELFEESVLPALHEQEGYEGCYVLLSQEGKVARDDVLAERRGRAASRLSGFYQAQIEKFVRFVVLRRAAGP